MTKTQTKKLDIVREVIEIINECVEDNMEIGIDYRVCMYLKDNYGYDRSEATEMLIGTQLIIELGLL
jgi:hypothetical protein